MCSRRSIKLCAKDDCLNCLNRSFSSSDYAEKWSETNIENPRHVLKWSKEEYKFNCDDCKHTFLSTPCWISHGYGCSFCFNRKLCENDDCQICLLKSFASTEESLFWSQSNNITPRQVFKHSNNKYDFVCDKCKHTINKSPNDISSGTWCIFCANQKLCEDECQICFEKSFETSDKAIYWSDTNSKNPRNVFKNSDQHYNFNCDECHHTFDMKPRDVSNGVWCPFCTNRKLCNEDCEVCLDKSFSINEKSKFWSAKNIEKPREVFNQSNQKYIFDCPHCNSEYIAALYMVTRGTWCNCTKNKTETKLFEYLMTNADVKIEKQKRFEWCKNKIKLPFDFCLEDYKLIIELDGLQHFGQVMNWRSPEETQKNDKYKMECAKKNGYSVIRLFQKDVLEEKNDWDIKLKNSIKKYAIPTIIYIGDIYEKGYIENMG
ncbi:MAG: restriction endonuclease [Hyperionvirus sp.]|uniref:Restriction endonuclease n=1 Tax=Hyperionvirus sp. TaxID=2487770 RepID=A0A3G5ABX8_9VIRU|nr:MAG: restriction endonuclease [Hyperionvirus sp.]